MSRNFTGQCFGCGGRGHRRAECPNNRAGGDTESVDGSVHREPPAYGRQERAGLYNEQFGQAGGFGGSMNAPPPLFFNQQQQHQQYQPQPQQYQQQQQQAYQPLQQQQQYQQQGPIMPQPAMGVQPFMGVQVAPAGERHLGVMHDATAANLPAALEEFRRETGIENPSVTFTSGQTAREMQNHFAPLSVRSERERMRTLRRVDISSIPVMNMSDPARPAQVPQRQAGRGALPGARNAQPNRGGLGMLGHYRVEKPRAQGQQQRQKAIEGSGRGKRSAHTDHAPGFGCKVCGATDHREEDCAKPSTHGDSTYCPWHQTVSGSEQHAASECRQCVDKCWEAAVGQGGDQMPRGMIDSFVTDFVRHHRGGRPEPRCGNIHSHWAMCVSRYIRAVGLDGLDASCFPVRRSEMIRRMRTRQLPWDDFDYQNAAESRMRFRDTYWDCEDEEELLEKLRDHARDGIYQTASQRRERRAAQDEEAVEEETDGMDIDKSASGNEEENRDSDHMSDSPSHSTVGSGRGSEENDYRPPTERGPSEERSGDHAPEPGSAARWGIPKPPEPYAPGAHDVADFGDDE